MKPENTYIVDKMNRASGIRPTRSDFMKMLGKGDIRLEPKTKPEKALTTRERHAKAAAPVQQDALNPVEGFHVQTAQERRLSECYQRAAEKLLRIRRENLFSWREAERVAKALHANLVEALGTKDASFQILSEQAAYSDPFGVFFEIKHALTPEERRHADHIVDVAWDMKKPCLEAATDRGLALMHCSLYAAAKYAAAIEGGA